MCGQLGWRRGLNDGRFARPPRTVGVAFLLPRFARGARGATLRAAAYAPIAGCLRRRRLGVASGLACGRERLQKVSRLPRKDVRRCVYFSDRYVEWLGLPAKPSARFARCCTLLVPGVGKIGALSDILPTVPQNLPAQLAASESAPGESPRARATAGRLRWGPKPQTDKLTYSSILGHLWTVTNG